ncbi:CRE-LIN-65 protein [Caenorhabditis remanei]|uniref:CRE-LIN-65 protein n=1 Tax=Caenorhabditis remanei TaxID=31234 RepID=E3LXQ9_CAERE|nr:CRE-LIN-65 protein [Caenorhabditis remanei]
MSEILDDSILNSEDTPQNNIELGCAATGRIDLNEDQIAELLGDDRTNGENNEPAAEKVVNEVEMAEEEINYNPDASSPENTPNVDAEIVENNVAPAEEIMDEDALLAEIPREEDASDEGFEEVGNGVVDEDEQEEEVISADSTTENVEEVAVVENDVRVEILLDSDGDVVEEDVIHMETVDGNTSRKRNAEVSSPRFPSSKRQKNQIATAEPFITAREEAINLITRIYGSWDEQLSVPRLRILNDMKHKNFKHLVDFQTEQTNKLHSEVKKLKEELVQERVAHATTTEALRELTDEAIRMRKQITILKSTLTQPRTDQLIQHRAQQHASITQAAPPARYSIQHHPANIPNVSQHPHHVQQQMQQQMQHQQKLQQRHYHQQQQQQHHHRQQQQQMRYNLQAIAQRRSTGQNAPQFNGAPHGNVSIVRGNPIPSLMLRPPPQQEPFNLKWTPIPQPNGMGHTDTNGVRTGTFGPPLIDASKPNDNTLKLHVPYCPANNVISSGDSARLPTVPKCFETLHASPDLTVHIVSTPVDFRETWQIAGKINYEYLGMLDKTTIQVYVQVSSLKFAGMSGAPIPENPMNAIDWGISKKWPCKAKSHKFRVVFHQQQMLPVNDRLTVIAVATNPEAGTIQVSQPAFINLV